MVKPHSIRQNSFKSQLIEWNGYEVRQTLLLYVFGSLLCTKFNSIPIISGCKEVSFTASHSASCSQHYSSRKVISTSPQKDFGVQFFCNLNSSKNFTCPSGKLRTEFDSPIAKSTTPEYQTPVSLHAVILILLSNKNVTVVNKKQRIESVRQLPR